MNKELIKKYKPEFEHWLNGGKLLVRFATAKNPYKWYNIEEDFDAKSWNGHYGAQYIIDDSYSDYRKALAEGKPVQVNVNYWAFPETDTKNYQDLSIDFTNWNKYSVECYRIKPEEPKFKKELTC